MGGPNHYAAFGANPVGFSDPMGLAVFDPNADSYKPDPISSLVVGLEDAQIGAAQWLASEAPEQATRSARRIKEEYEAGVMRSGRFATKELEGFVGAVPHAIAGATDFALMSEEEQLAFIAGGIIGTAEGIANFNLADAMNAAINADTDAIALNLGEAGFYFVVGGVLSEFNPKTASFEPVGSGQWRPGRIRSKQNAYDIANRGGKHSGFLRNYRGRPIEEIKSGVESIRKRVAEHEAWIADPELHVPDFKNLDPRRQEWLIEKKWPRDIKRQKEQLEVLRTLLDEE